MPDEVIFVGSDIYVNVSRGTLKQLEDFINLFKAKLPGYEKCSLDDAISTLATACEVANKTGVFPYFT